VDKEDLVGGVDARAEMLAHPPEAEVAEDGYGSGRSGVGAVGLEHFGPNDVIAVEGGTAIGSLLVVDERVGLGLELAQALFPGGVQVIAARGEDRCGDVQ